MRLLNTRTLKLEDFLPDKIPKYAILSHTWGEEEVSFHDIQTDNWSWKQAAFKIKGICELASQDFSYVWVDTCCIDKSSSAELSESINSMYKWYQDAEICYVYLQDVEAAEGWDDPTRYVTEHRGPSRHLAQLRGTRWFTRGWTLQELLAPRNVHFLSRNFEYIATREELAYLVWDITGISISCLRQPNTASAAQKMSWASSRRTSRPEDKAYSLLGNWRLLAQHKRLEIHRLTFSRPFQCQYAIAVRRGRGECILQAAIGDHIPH